MTFLYVCYKSEQKKKDLKNQLDLGTDWIWWGGWRNNQGQLPGF